MNEGKLSPDQRWPQPPITVDGVVYEVFCDGWLESYAIVDGKEVGPARNRLIDLTAQIRAAVKA